jgi:L-amino acid N-acyltransferase YncA
MSTIIRAVRSNDAARLCEIYNHYVRETIVTFEEVPVAEADMERRVGETGALPWLVVEQDGVVMGNAVAKRWKERSAYRFSVETGVYLAPEAIGRGMGTELYAALLAQLRALGLHSAAGGIALPNAASVALHEKLGFEKVAHFKQVGFKLGRWIDVAYWQVLF